MSKHNPTILDKICRKLMSLQELLQENSPTLLVQYVIGHQMKKREIVKFRIKGHDVHIRMDGPDLNVARSSLGSEFRALGTAYDKNMTGLIIDGGGYIGTAALVFAEMYPNATIVTVEPSSENFRMLQKNIEGKKNIHAINAALSPVPSDNIVLRDRGTGEWGFTTVSAPQDRNATEMESVPVVTVDDILAKYGFDKVSIFKMDIEGAEFDFFKHQGWLEKTQILIIELHERIIAGCEKAFFAANGNRYIYRDEGEKYTSVGQNFFSQKTASN